MKVSIIIPVFNEQEVIADCLTSLDKQTFGNLEVIVVDDGSNDSSKFKVQNVKLENIKLKLLEQGHKGPGAARNLGVKNSSGEILIFVDADMEFEPDFIEKLTQPIIDGKAIGTFSRDEYLLNTDNPWARCWNLNFGRSPLKMHSDNYPSEQHVFRAILKSKFEKAGGFDENVGYTDDWSLANKLHTLATLAPGAKYYHRNPGDLSEVWRQARWYGKNEFLTGTFIRKLFNLLRFCPLFSLFKGFYGASKYKEPFFVHFKMVFDTAVFTSVLFSFFGEKKFK